MSSGMPELGSKISLISKADIRYEGRLFTVDPQECTIALASVRSFGTEDRETQYPVAQQSQVYDYILFRGSDIKDIRILNNVPSMPNDPAIVQMSVPPTLGAGANPPPQFGAQFNHPVVGQAPYPQYHPMAGFSGSIHSQMNKTSELSSSVDLAPQPATAPIGSGIIHHSNQVKDQGSMLDLIGGGSQQNASRSGTPAHSGHRKSPTSDQSTQVGVASGSGQQRDSRRGNTQQQKQGNQQQQHNRTNSRNRQRYPSGSGQSSGAVNSTASAPVAHHNQHPQHNQHHQHNQHNQHNPHQQNQYNQHPGASFGRGGWRGRGRGRGRGGFMPRPNTKNTLKFDNDYDFEQANTEFEELRSQLAKAKISDGDAKPEVHDQYATTKPLAETDAEEPQRNQLLQPGEVDKKDDSGNETGAGEPEVEDDYAGYDKAKSFFDNISCEAVERSKGRSQRTDWRTERKLNSETFGVASARRGAWRGRGGWRQYGHQPWRGQRGAPRGRPGPPLQQPRRAAAAPHPPQPAVTAK